jgi:SAM-dependent methyltransferase
LTRAARDSIDNKAVYRSSALVAGYDAGRRIGEADDFVNAWEVGYFVAQVQRLAGPSGSVIDFGAGTGKLALAFARLGYRVTAFDQSPAMLERLKDKARAEGLDIDCQSGDIVAGPPPGRTGAYDVAVSSRVLMHVADPTAMIAHMAAVARKGIVLDAPRRLSPNRLLVGLRALTGGEVYRCVDDRELAGLMAGRGLTPIDATPMFVLPIGLHLALRHRRLSQALERLLAGGRPFASTLFTAAAKT